MKNSSHTNQCRNCQKHWRYQANKMGKVKLVHISTDHLFDGSNAHLVMRKRNYPCQCLWKNKKPRRYCILDNNPDALVIRTNFFGWGPSYKPSFSDKILNSLERKTPFNYLMMCITLQYLLKVCVTAYFSFS